jgi:hypothetical protein
MEISKMKIIIAVVIQFAIVCGAATCAQASDKKKAAPAPQALTIPKDAVPNPDGTTFNYTDKQGKKWVYIKTPFGVMKNPATGTPAATPPDLGSTTAVDKGDSVMFERPSPFGTMSWEKKKSELTDDERHILDTQNAKTGQND